MSERIGISRVYVEEEMLSPEEIEILVDLTMTTLPKVFLHQSLAQLGYRLGEGVFGEINEMGDIGSIHNLFRLEADTDTPEPVAQITTFNFDDE